MGVNDAPGSSVPTGEPGLHTLFRSTTTMFSRSVSSAARGALRKSQVGTLRAYAGAEMLTQLVVAVPDLRVRDTGSYHQLPRTQEFGR
jgi:hypothetical protein